MFSGRSTRITGIDARDLSTAAEVLAGTISGLKECKLWGRWGKCRSVLSDVTRSGHFLPAMLTYVALREYFQSDLNINWDIVSISRGSE